MYGGFPITTSAGSSSTPGSRKSAWSTHSLASSSAVDTGYTGCDQEVTAERAGHLHVLSLEVIGPDRLAKRGEVTSVVLGALNKTLDDGAKERPGAAGWLHQVQGAKITVGGVPGEIEQYLDHPSAGEHLAVVLDARGCKCHSHTLGTGTDGRYVDTAQGSSSEPGCCVLVRSHLC